MSRAFASTDLTAIASIEGWRGYEPGAVLNYGVIFDGTRTWEMSGPDALGVVAADAETGLIWIYPQDRPGERRGPGEYETLQGRVEIVRFLEALDGPGIGVAAVAPD